MDYREKLRRQREKARKQRLQKIASTNYNSNTKSIVGVTSNTKKKQVDVGGIIGLIAWCVMIFLGWLYLQPLILEVWPQPPADMVQSSIPTLIFPLMLGVGILFLIVKLVLEFTNLGDMVIEEQEDEEPEEGKL